LAIKADNQGRHRNNGFNGLGFMAITRNGRQLTLWLSGLALVMAGLWPEWRDFFRLWHESIIYNHGFLVLAGIPYLLYRRREALSRLTFQPSWIAFLLLAGATVALLLVRAADIQVIRLLLVPIILVLWGWALVGRSITEAAAGPVLLLIFAVPLWDELSPLLQHITVFFNDIFLRLLDIEAEIREFYIILDVGIFHVETGCSGVRYLMVGLFSGSVYGQLYYRNLTLKIALVVAAALLSMLSNWIRVFGIIAAGHFTNMESSLLDDHEVFGWITFAVFTLTPLIMIAGRLDRGDHGTPIASVAHGQAEQAAVWTRTNPFWVAGASFLVFWPILVPAALEPRTEKAAAEWSPDLIRGVPGWQGPLAHANVWEPDYTSPDIDRGGVYVSDDLERVQLHLTGYRRQSQERELIYFRNRLADPKRWQVLSERRYEPESSEEAAIPAVIETVIEQRDNGTRVLVWSWYQVGGVMTESRMEAKVLGALNRLTGDQRGALWALAGVCEARASSVCEGQRNVFEKFLNQTSAWWTQRH
jgi:exosortase A